MRRKLVSSQGFLLGLLCLTVLEAREFHLTPHNGKSGTLRDHNSSSEREPSHNHTVHHHAEKLEAKRNETHEEHRNTTLTPQYNQTAETSHPVGQVLGSAKGKSRPLPLPRSKKLDIVIAHYDVDRIDAMKEFWLWFFELQTVRVWEPYVFLYTQSPSDSVTELLQPFIEYGGEVVRLENAGRESHVYLQHMVRNYEDLANHTLFTQDAPNIDFLPKKFEKMFVEKTGYLPLSFMGHVDCFESWNGVIPPKVVPQLYGLFTHSMCPPSGYAAGFEGQFIVSKQRILDQPLGIYRHLIDMVAAPNDHWIHEYHDFTLLKDHSDPYMGHALERAWSLAFNCYEVWRQANCNDCEQSKQHEDCGRDACQCFDVS